jgi:plastocyanin
VSARLVVLVCSLAALVLPSAAARADNPVLVGTVGQNDAFAIALRDANGNRVTHLDPGTYTIQVHDFSAEHNFHLFGPGVDQGTDVDGIGDATWTVTFQDGTYRFQCDVHATQMRGSFTVGTVATPPPPVQLKATVGPGRTISLRDADGARVTALTSPVKVVITVNDRTRTDNFHLKGPGVNKATGVGFRGRVKWTLSLAAGKYVYRSDKHKTLRGSFTVTAG